MGRISHQCGLVLCKWSAKKTLSMCCASWAHLGTLGAPRAMLARSQCETGGEGHPGPFRAQNFCLYFGIRRWDRHGTIAALWRGVGPAPEPASCHSLENGISNRSPLERCRRTVLACERAAGKELGERVVLPDFCSCCVYVGASPLHRHSTSTTIQEAPTASTRITNI